MKVIRNIVATILVAFGFIFLTGVTQDKSFDDGEGLLLVGLIVLVFLPLALGYIFTVKKVIYSLAVFTISCIILIFAQGFFWDIILKNLPQLILSFSLIVIVTFVSNAVMQYNSIATKDESIKKKCLVT